MSVKAINSSTDVVRYNRSEKKKNNQHQQTFTGSFNPIVMLMDAIDRGGFAASFIAQDGIGMVAPRIYEGLNRNRKEDENGKKTGPLNWEFARREGIREVLSGPSAFLIPLGILSIIKRVSGSANNVHVSHIKTLGQNLTEYIAKNPEQLKNSVELKRGYYAKVFENALRNSTDESFVENDVKNTAKKFADTLVEVETKRAGKNRKSANELYSKLVEEYMNIRKSHAAPSSDELGVTMKMTDGELGTNIRRLTQSLTDYTGDVLNKAAKKGISPENIQEFIAKFNKQRAGTRVLSNLGMWSAVVVFYTLIPKLYNLGLKHDPGLKGLEDTPDNKAINNTKPDKKAADKTDKKEDKDVSFTGNFVQKLGDTAAKKGGVSNILKIFEFNGASMSVPAMLTLLFGFCLPPRYVNAKSDKERKEILVRDISSFVAILFGAKALSRGFSDMFAKISGLALNVKPKNHSDGLFQKIKNYFTAGAGVEVLSSEQIVSKYSDLSGYKDGINGFFKFLQENGGNVKKVLKLDKKVKENADAILQRFKNKSLKEATLEEIDDAFRKAKGSIALENIYSIFSSKDNKFINRAKTYNSAFGFASTLVLVPAFMMWLARYCEKMTKNAVEKEKAEKEKLQQNVLVQSAKFIPSNKPTMAGFLK